MLEVIVLDSIGCGVRGIGILTWRFLIGKIEYRWEIEGANL